MACGDVIATLCSASTSAKHLYTGFEWNPGPLGQFTCKLAYYVISVAMLCSIFSLVAMTCDRFLAVSRPLKYKHQSSWTKFAIPVVWTASLAIPSRFALGGFEVRGDVLRNNKTYCVAMHGQNDGIFVACVGYVIPHVVMVILYIIIAYKLWTRRVPGDEQAERQLNTHQTARKVTLMIICVLFTFNACWLPIFTTFYIVSFFPALFKYDNNFVPPLVSIAAMANGPLNALIFAVFCEKFRIAFKTALKFERLVALRNIILNRFRQGRVSAEPASRLKPHLAGTAGEIQQSIQENRV